MKSKWFAEAGRYNGMPLDDRSTSEVLGTPRPQLAPEPFADGKPRYTYGPYYPGGSEIPEAVAPNIRGRTYNIVATVDFSTTDFNEPLKGVLYSHGGRFGGHSFYLTQDTTTKKVRLCYVYNWLGRYQQKISCEIPPTTNGESVKLRVSFRKSSEQQYENQDFLDLFGLSTVGTVQMQIDGTPADELWEFSDDGENWFSWRETQIVKGWTDRQQMITQPGKFALCGEGMNIGRDGGQPVSMDYNAETSEFEGATIKQVEVTIRQDFELNLGERAKAHAEKIFAGMLWRD